MRPSNPPSPVNASPSGGPREYRQLREPLKHLEKNIPDLQKMAAAYLSLGTSEELRQQIVDVALERAFLADPLPTDARSFKARVKA